MAGIRMFAQSAQLRDLRTPPAVSLRDWNAEGWYVRTGQNVLAFTTENHTTPPQEVIDMFHRLESIPPAATESGNVSDVCLGFCYDPLAGLWVVYMTDPLRRAEYDPRPIADATRTGHPLYRRWNCWPCPELSF